MVGERILRSNLYSPLPLILSGLLLTPWMQENLTFPLLPPPLVHLFIPPPRFCPRRNRHHLTLMLNTVLQECLGHLITDANTQIRKTILASQNLDHYWSTHAQYACKHNLVGKLWKDRYWWHSVLVLRGLVLVFLPSLHLPTGSCGLKHIRLLFWLNQNICNHFLIHVTLFIQYCRSIMMSQQYDKKFACWITIVVCTMYWDHPHSDQ